MPDPVAAALARGAETMYFSITRHGDNLFGARSINTALDLAQRHADITGVALTVWRMDSFGVGSQVKRVRPTWDVQDG